MGINMFNYREDNVQKPIRFSKMKTTSAGVEFHVMFNINEINFCSRLNEDIHSKMETASYHTDITDAIIKDYKVSKRQYAFYLLDCREQSNIRHLCNRQDIN